MLPVALEVMPVAGSVLTGTVMETQLKSSAPPLSRNVPSESCTTSVKRSRPAEPA